MHSFHPDVHTHGLADDCESCEAAAQDPWNLLDEQMLRALFARTVDRGGARSVPEATAIAEIRRTLHRFTQLAKLNPEDAYGVLAAERALPVRTLIPPPAAPEPPSEDVGTPGLRVQVIVRGMEVPLDPKLALHVLRESLIANGWQTSYVVNADRQVFRRDLHDDLVLEVTP